MIPVQKYILCIGIFFAVGLCQSRADAQNKEDNKEQEAASDKIVARAEILAERGNFNRAVQELIPILDYYPEYSKIDEVMCKLGNNLTDMGLYGAADKIFKHMVANNIDSPVVPYALFGLEKLYYLQQKYARVIDYFKLLREKYPDASIGEGIYYYAGQSYFFQGDFDNALLAFDAIEERSEFWGYALYTRALANFKKKNVDEAISDLKKIIVLPRLYEKWLSLQERANLVRGLTLYELGEFEQGLSFLKKVSSDGDNYPRALLGIGWCYLKLQQYQNMVKPLETFVKNCQGSEFLPEVYLLLGQVHLKIRLYDKSIFYFSEILNMFPSISENSNLLESIGKKIKPVEDQIERHRLDLLLQESKLLNTLQLPSKKWLSNYMTQEIKELEKHRSILLEQIINEKRSLQDLTQSLNSLKIIIQIRTREWRSYGEYGISRALFLRGQEG